MAIYLFVRLLLLGNLALGLANSDASVSNYTVFGRFGFLSFGFGSVRVLQCPVFGFENKVSVLKMLQSIWQH